VVSVGPLECMPNKIAEAQLFHVAEREGLLALTLPVNGDSLDAEVIDNFAFEVHKRFRQKATILRRHAGGGSDPAQAPVSPGIHQPHVRSVLPGIQ
jgi:hypothetical protein